MSEESPQTGRELRPRGFLRTVMLVTRPDFILGISLGIGAAIIGQLAMSYRAGWYVLIGVLSLVAVLALGAFIGYYVAASYARRLKDSAQETSKGVVQALSELSSEALAYAGQDRAAADPAKLQQSLGDLFRRSSDLVGWGAAMVGRALAFGRLAALLGAAISFAIFLATYMQVEKLELQNRLMEASNHLQEASRRTLLAAEIEAVMKDLPRDQGKAIDARQVESIVNLSVSLRPYRYLQYEEPDTYKSEGTLSPDTGASRLSDRALSAERGRLLLRLLGSKPSNLRDVVTARPDFSRSDLRGTRIAGLDFSLLFMSYSDLRDAEGFMVKFQGAQLPFADFSGAELLGVNFSSPADPVPTIRRNWTDLRMARFVGARLNKANFSGAELTGADLSDAVLFGANFTDARMQGVNLTGAALAQADTPDQVAGAKAEFSALMAKLPEAERARWESDLKSPDANHKYLGTTGGKTVYLFIREAKR